MKGIVDLGRRIDPRRSVAARLLLAFLLISLIPGAVFVIVLERRLTDLHESSVDRLAVFKSTEKGIQINQDASSRAEWVDRRVKVAEETGWALAEEVRLALTEPGLASRPLPAPDEHGHVWNRTPEGDTVGFLSKAHAKDPAARRDASRLAALAASLTAARERRPTLRSVSIWTASGAMRHSPWVAIDETAPKMRELLEDYAFNTRARFPPAEPATGDVPVWVPATAGPRLLPEGRYVAVFVPVRDGAGRLLAGVAQEVDARRFFAEAVESGDVPGDVWFALDADGRPMLMPERAAALLQWHGESQTPETLAESPDRDRQALARAVLGSPRTKANGYPLNERSPSGEVTRREHWFASAKVPSTGWVFVEGLSADRLLKLGQDAAEEVPPARYNALKRDVLLLYLYLFLAVMIVTALISRRITAPVERLVRAAEDIGEGRAVELSHGDSRDAFGRLEAALDRMSRRVERRVETLRRLHTLLRTTYRATDPHEIFARCAEAIAAFTRAERVLFLLHNADTNRLEAAFPGWNLPEEMATAVKMPVEGRSISGMVFRTGDIYASNDIPHDPYAAHALEQIVGPVHSAVFAALKTEDKTIGVAVALNRPGGFGHEEVDAITSIADAASLLIANARLYETLTGTVEELRRASRLKDQFLQNVNHELRTPLTSIVGWTDLFEEGGLDEATMQRGQRQVRQSARILLALIDDLLDLARMDRGALILDLRSVQIGEVVQRSIETVRMMSEAQGVALILAPLPEQLPPLRADPLRLQQILWNLLTNAIKFSRRHGRVVVRVERDGDRYLVSVEDDGIGIHEGQLPHIFERFRQADGSPTRKHAGMGIGLSLTRSLVELHGGTIWAESALGHGSRFTFSLPIRPGDRWTAGSAEEGEVRV